MNLLKTSVDDVIAAFIEAGYTCVMTRDEAEEEKQDATPKYIRYKSNQTHVKTVYRKSNSISTV